MKRRDGVDLMAIKNKQAKLPNLLSPAQIRLRAEFRPRWDDCLHGVAIVANISTDDIMARCRLRHRVIARQVLMEVAHQIAALSHASIGRKLGMDHTTILYGRAAISALINAGDTAAAKMLDAAIVQSLDVARQRYEGERRLARLTIDDVARQVYMDRRHRRAA